MEEAFNCLLVHNNQYIDINDVNKYIGGIEVMLKNPPHLFLLINFDEIGFGRKHQEKNVYISKSSCFKSFFREQTGSYHVSVVVAATAGCNNVTSLYLFPRKSFDEELKGNFFFYIVPTTFLLQKDMQQFDQHYIESKIFKSQMLKW